LLVQARQRVHVLCCLADRHPALESSCRRACDRMVTREAS
jgi:hypothetical protein